jgi:hypothetical protein
VILVVPLTSRRPSLRRGLDRAAPVMVPVAGFKGGRAARSLVEVDGAQIVERAVLNEQLPGGEVDIAELDCPLR